MVDYYRSSDRDREDSTEEVKRRRIFLGAGLAFAAIVVIFFVGSFFWNQRSTQEPKSATSGETRSAAERRPEVPAPTGVPEAAKENPKEEQKTASAEVRPAEASEDPGLGRRLTTFVMGRTPTLYAVNIEKNGKDYRLGVGVPFEVTYRDEFVIKGAVTDALIGRFVAVELSGGDKPVGPATPIKGVAMVDKAMAAESDPAKKKEKPKFSLAVSYRGNRIGEIPIHVAVTPQDWVRSAKTAEGGAQIASLKKAAELNRQDLNVHRMLAMAYAQRGQTDQAISEYRLILRQRADDLPSMVELAGLLMEKKDYAEALGLYQKILPLNRKDASARANAGLAAGKVGKWNQAAAYYADSLKLNPDNTVIHLRLGEALEKLGKSNEAMEHYRVYLKHKPDDPEAMAVLGGIYLKGNRYDEAIKTFTELTRKNPRDAAGFTGLGLAYGAKGNAKAEIENYRKALELRPRDFAVHYNLASAYARGKQYTEAGAEFEKALEIRPNDGDALIRLAEIHARQKKYDQAVRQYERALKTNPRNGGAYAGLGYAYGELKQYGKSAAAFEKALALGVKDPQIQYNLGFAYDKLGSKKKSMASYEKYASTGNNYEVLTVMANEYMKRKDYASAVRMYEKMAKMQPKRAGVHASLGYAYGLKGDTDKEIESYRTALRLDRDDDTTHYNLGAALEKKGLFSEALKEYQAAHELNPEGKAARKIPQLKIKMLQQKYKEK